MNLNSKMIQVGCYINRWKKNLYVIIEKGKGSILGKLRIIQLIEAYFQTLLRKCTGLRDDDKIENYNRMSKKLWI